MTGPPTTTDSEGALPHPWVAHRADDGRLFYHDPATGQSTWQRPDIRLPRDKVFDASGRPLFGSSWQDLRGEELRGSTSPAEAMEAFRDFCCRLFPGGEFARRSARGAGVVWRLGAQEPVGLALHPPTRTVCLTLNRDAVPDPAAAVAPSRPGAPLTRDERLAAVRSAQRGFVARQPAAEVLVAPESHLLRRYCAQLAGGPSCPSAPRSGAQGSENVRHLALYLQEFGLLWPMVCELTGLAFRDEAEFAEHLLSERHVSRVAHAQRAADRLGEVRLGEVSLSEWLPKHKSGYRSLLEWRDRIFQFLPMADGRVLRFSHLAGLGDPTPASSLLALGRPPPPLAAARAPRPQEPPPSTSRSQMWSMGGEAAPAGDRLVGGVDSLLLFVRRSNGSTAGQHAVSFYDAQDELAPPWQAIRDPAGQTYYFNEETKVAQWHPPPLVDLGATWRGAYGAGGGSTPLAVSQRFHRVSPMPRRAAP